MKNLFVVLFFILSISTMNAQEVVKLWQGVPPTSNGIVGSEVDQNGRVSNVVDPEMYIYRPQANVDKNMTVIICPGGGYSRLAIDHEGHEFAQWLQKKGITGVVLKYRLPNTHKNVPLEDFHQAIRYIRSTANASMKVGVAGFSAGGHLASTASTHYDSQELRPDFSILFYPVITMGEYTHQGSKNNLLGEKPSANDLHYYSNETQVKSTTPPAILLLSDDDKAVPPQNSVMYYEALKQNNVPATMYIFPVGGHGWGMRSSYEYHTQMLHLLEKWLNDLYPNQESAK